MRFASCLILIVLLPSCDWFQTRDPEPPSNRTSTFNPPVTPDIVLANLKSSVAEYLSDNYVKCFSAGTDSRYSFLPSTEAASAYASIFQDWEVEDERTYFRNLGEPHQGVPFLDFENQRTILSGSDSVIYNMNYRLFFPHRSTGEPQYVRGNMQVSLRADEQQRWSIYRWQDSGFPGDTMQTWSYLKAKFRLRS